MKLLLSSMKTLIESEDYSESRIKNSVPASFPAIGRFSPVYNPYWMQENPRTCTCHWRVSEQFSDSEAACGTIGNSHRWVSERPNNLSEEGLSSKNFKLKFLHKQHKN